MTDSTGYKLKVTILDFITISDIYNVETVHAVYMTQPGYIQHAPLNKFWIEP